MVLSIKDKDNKIKEGVVFVASIITGFTVSVSTREETLIFAVPLLFALVYRSASRRCFIISVALFLIAYAPNALIKYSVFGSFLENVRATDHGAGYLEKLFTYLSLDRFQSNLLDVVFDSSYSGLTNINRKALLQASPWFWLSPLGLIIYIIKNRTWFLYFLFSSIFLLIFYLAGENVSALKLKFHCLRYVSPAFIALSFLAVYALSSICDYLAIYFGQLMVTKKNSRS